MALNIKNFAQQHQAYLIDQNSFEMYFNLNK